MALSSGEGLSFPRAHSQLMVLVAECLSQDRNNDTHFTDKENEAGWRRFFGQ